MRDDNHRKPFLRELFHDIQHFSDHLRIQRRCRLVEQHELRVHAEGARNRDTLFLAAGDRSYIRKVLHANLAQMLHSCFLCLFLRSAKHLDLRRHAVFQNVHVVEQIELLETHAYLRPVRVNVFRMENVFPEHFNRAAVRVLEQVDAAKERRFSGAGTADQTDDLSLRNRKVDTLQHFQRAEALMNVLDFHERICFGHRMLLLYFTLLMSGAFEGSVSLIGRLREAFDRFIRFSITFKTTLATDVIRR